MKKIHVVRHGRTVMNEKGLVNGQLDDPLVPEGIEQAKATRDILPKDIKRIYASSLSRAKDTAKILNEEMNLPITFHDELREVNFGFFQGNPYTGELKERHRMLDYNWRPSGESVEDFKDRLFKILKEINAENNDGEALIVAHGGIIRLMYFIEHGKTLGDIENASLYTFDLDKILK